MTSRPEDIRNTMVFTMKRCRSDFNLDHVLRSYRKPKYRANLTVVSRAHANVVHLEARIEELEAYFLASRCPERKKLLQAMRRPWRLWRDERKRGHAVFIHLGRLKGHYASLAQLLLKNLLLPLSIPDGVFSVLFSVPWEAVRIISAKIRQAITETREFFRDKVDTATDLSGEKYNGRILGLAMTPFVPDIERLSTLPMGIKPAIELLMFLAESSYYPRKKQRHRHQYLQESREADKLMRRLCVAANERFLDLPWRDMRESLDRYRKDCGNNQFFYDSIGELAILSGASMSSSSEDEDSSDSILFDLNATYPDTSSGSDYVDSGFEDDAG